MKNEIKEITTKQITITLNQREVSKILEDLNAVKQIYSNQLNLETKYLIKYLEKLK